MALELISFLHGSMRYDGLLRFCGFVSFLFEHDLSGSVVPPGCYPLRRRLSRDLGVLRLCLTVGRKKQGVAIVMMNMLYGSLALNANAEWRSAAQANSNISTAEKSARPWLYLACSGSCQDAIPSAAAPHPLAFVTFGTITWSWDGKS